MVLAEKNAESARNGRKSQGPSPNGQTDTSSEDDGVPAEKIRVGRDYQVNVPDLVPMSERKLELCPEKALLVWSPSTDIPESKLEEYIALAKEKYGYNGEQALGMLFWHKHNLEKAESDLANFTPFPDEWTVEDKVLFEQAFQFHGKTFQRIRQMLPDKSIASLVKYYYSWKKTRTKTSLMDRQARKLTTTGKEGENGSDNGSELASTDSEHDEKIQSNKQQMSSLKRKLADGVEDMRPAESPCKVNPRWSNEEMLLAVEGLRKYGKDFATIADVIGTKSETHLRNFFNNYRRKYNLDAVIKEFESENGPILAEEEKEEKVEAEQPAQIADAALAEPAAKRRSPVATTQTAK